MSAGVSPQQPSQRFRYNGAVTRVPVVLSYEEWIDAAGRLDRCPSADDVPITRDGRRLDSTEKVAAFLAEVKADLAAGHSLVAELS